MFGSEKVAHGEGAEVQPHLMMPEGSAGICVFTYVCVYIYVRLSVCVCLCMCVCVCARAKALQYSPT